MRVIAGTLRGRRLLAPDGLETRPTADRLRESIFNILADGVRERRVLDLFAGTGALGIEALSRGARSALFVDRAPAALAVIRRNLHQLGLEARSRVVGWNLLANLNCLRGAPAAFDLIFMDPPYESQAVAPTLAALAACGAIAPAARVVIEHSLREPIAPDLVQWVLRDQRKFGKTIVSFMDFVI